MRGKPGVADMDAQTENGVLHSIAELIAKARPAADPEFDLHTTWLEEIHNEN